MTTFINASNCNEGYRAVNLPIVFDIPVPPGFTKEGNLKWLIKNEPWKMQGSDIFDNIVDSDESDSEQDEIVFESNEDELEQKKMNSLTIR